MPTIYDLDNPSTKSNTTNTRSDECTKRLADSVVEWSFLLAKSTLLGMPIASILDAVLVYGILR